METDKFLTTEEFLAIFENCYEWPEIKLKELTLSTNLLAHKLYTLFNAKTFQ